MSSAPQTKNEAAADAITVLRSGFHSSTEALSKLEQYIRHLEELLLEQLGRQEFEQRLESLVLRDQRNEESLFIPEDNSVSRKRGSSSKETGSSPKKSRSNSQVSSLNITSGLGRSIFEKGRPSHDDSPDVSPRTSRKPSVSEQPIVDCQQATTEKTLVRRPINPPRPGPRRTSQSAMLPNKHPSYHSGSSSLVAILAAPPQPTQPSASSRKDPVQSEKASKQSRSGSVSSICGASSLQESTSATSASKTAMTPTLSKKLATPSAQISASSTKKPSIPSTKTSSPSYSQALSSPAPSSRPSSVPNKPGSGSGKKVLSLNQQPLSSTRKPSRASKKG